MRRGLDSHTLLFSFFFFPFFMLIPIVSNYDEQSYMCVVVMSFALFLYITYLTYYLA